jgi:hypothetical protein
MSQETFGGAKQTAVRGTLKKREKGAVSSVSVQVSWIRLWNIGVTHRITAMKKISTKNIGSHVANREPIVN